MITSPPRGLRHDSGVRRPRLPALLFLLAVVGTPASGLSDEPAAPPEPAAASESAAAPAPAAAPEGDPDYPGFAEATVGSHGGLVQLPNGMTVGLLPGSARDGVGWHLLHMQLAEPLLPSPEGVGPRAIDRRSSTPLGMVEGPAQPISPGFQLRLLDPDPAGDVGTGMVDAEGWNSWLESVPDDLMPWLDPAYTDQRKGFLVAVPDAGPPGTDERVSVWLRSPGGLRRTGDVERVGAPRPGDDAVLRWDPCLLLGRLDAAGTAWFYLAESSCGFDATPVWTPLREQSQKEFADWVLDQTPPKEAGKLRKELKTMARDETKREKEQ